MLFSSTALDPHPHLPNGALLWYAVMVVVRELWACNVYIIVAYFQKSCIMQFWCWLPTHPPTSVSDFFFLTALELINCVRHFATLGGGLFGKFSWVDQELHTKVALGKWTCSTIDKHRQPQYTVYHDLCQSADFSHPVALTSEHSNIARPPSIARTCASATSDPASRPWEEWDHARGLLVCTVRGVRAHACVRACVEREWAVHCAFFHRDWGWAWVLYITAFLKWIAQK